MRIISATTALLSGLKANTAYQISVRAQNSAGFGPGSAAFNVTTKKPRRSTHPGAVEMLPLFGPIDVRFYATVRKCSV